MVLIVFCANEFTSASVSDLVRYENCGPNDLLYGEKLSSVVNYVMKMVGIDKRYGEDKASEYIRFCEAFAHNLNDPFVNDGPRRFIGKSPYSSGEDLGGLISRKRYFSDEFVVLKVFRNGNSLDIIPTYTWTERKVKRILFFRDTSYDYGKSQQKFTLSSGYLRQIVDQIKQAAVNNWD